MVLRYVCSVGGRISRFLPTLGFNPLFWIFVPPDVNNFRLIAGSARIGNNCEMRVMEVLTLRGYAILSKIKLRCGNPKPLVSRHGK